MFGFWERHLWGVFLVSLAITTALLLVAIWSGNVWVWSATILASVVPDVSLSGIITERQFEGQMRKERERWLKIWG